MQLKFIPRKPSNESDIVSCVAIVVCISRCGFRQRDGLIRSSVVGISPYPSLPLVFTAKTGEPWQAVDFEVFSLSYSQSGFHAEPRGQCLKFVCSLVGWILHRVGKSTEY